MNLIKEFRTIALSVFLLLPVGITADHLSAQPDNPDKPNILFIMTDQQRFDALRRVQDELPVYNGKLKIRTPNLDRLSEEGAYFRNAYSPCAVCAPMRVTLRTGLTLEGHGAQSNGLVKESVYTQEPNLFQEKIENAETIDQILVEDRNYVSEYFGKWHMPVTYFRNRAGTAPVIRYNHYNFSNGSFLLNETDSWGSMYKDYLDYFNGKGEISKTFPEGTQENTYSKYAYYPVQLDVRYGMPTKTPLRSPPFESWETSQPNVMGEDDLGEKYTPSGTNGFIALQSLGRLCQQSDPFLLTVSFHNPHAPMVASEKFFDYYYENRDDLLIPPSILDKMENSGYGSDSRLIEAGYNDPEKVREWMACYYALVEEVDYWVGELLDTLEHYPGVRDNTIIVFTSDHGEMLGAHSLREKNKFLEESAHIPLIIKAPGQITPGTIVDESISTLDLFATLLDYSNAASYDNSHGKTLRRFIENSNYNKDYDEEHIVTEWDFREPNGTSLTRSLGGEINFLSMKGPYKLMMTKKASSSKLDMLYDISSDPYEMDNLVGTDGNSASDFVIGKAEHLKALLLDWMLRLDGEDKIYSDPKWNDMEGAGDIAEIRNRQTWKKIDLWAGDTVVFFGDVVDLTVTWTRNEWFYLGRTTDGTTTVSNVSIEGADADKFTVSEFTGGSIAGKEYRKIKIQFTPPTADFEISDARLRIEHDAGDDVVVRLANTDPASGSGLVIDPCNLLDGWEGDNTLELNPEKQQEGPACIEAEGSGQVDFLKLFTDSINTGLSAAEARLQFWYYVTDTSLLGGENKVELGSAGTADADAFQWDIDKSTLTEGWNFISLELADATTAGTPDLDAINWFRLYRTKTGSITSRIDLIHLSDGSEPLPGKPMPVCPGDGSQGIPVLTKLDWLAGANALEHKVYFDTVNPPSYLTKQAGTTFDPGKLQSEKTYYWQIREKNPSGTTAGEVWSFTTIGPPGPNYGHQPADGSTGVSTTIGMSWKPGAEAETHDVYFGTANPPPFIKTQPGNAYTPDQPLDFETTYYWNVDAVNSVGKNAGTVYSFTTRTRDASGIVPIDDCDSFSGWRGSNNAGLNTSDQKQGIGCLQSSGDITNDFQKAFDPAINTGISEADAQLVFWYYISDITKLDKSNQIEIGSGGKNDVDEYNWQPDPSTLKNGWNLMRLNFADANKKGAPSLGGINWFRIYRFKTGSLVSRIDNIRIIDKSVIIPSPGKAENPLPSHQSINAELATSLRWTPGKYAEFHNVYFGKNYPPEFIGEQPGNSFSPADLDSAITYYWRIDEVHMTDVTRGDTWSFTTADGTTSYTDILLNNKFTISPNPSRGMMVLELERFEDPYNIRVFDMKGEQVHQTISAQLKTRLNLTNLDKGNYIVEVNTGRERTAGLIILE